MVMHSLLNDLLAQIKFFLPFVLSLNDPIIKIIFILSVLTQYLVFTLLEVPYLPRLRHFFLLRKWSNAINFIQLIQHNISVLPDLWAMI